MEPSPTSEPDRYIYNPLLAIRKTYIGPIHLVLAVGLSSCQNDVRRKMEDDFRRWKGSSGKKNMSYIVGIEVGGTFTDAFTSEESGTVVAAKTSSTPPDVYSSGLFSRRAEGCRRAGGAAGFAGREIPGAGILPVRQEIPPRSANSKKPRQ